MLLCRPPATASAMAAATVVARPRRGTPLDSDPSRLSILSYNLLAPLYVRPIDQRTGGVQGFAAFEWAEDAHLDWDSRRNRLRLELEAARADVVCLQEVQFEPCGARDGNPVFDLPEWLRLPGYTVRIPGQRELRQIASRNKRVLLCEAAVGNALLYRSDRLQEDDCSGPLSATKKATDQETTRVGACLRGSGGSGLEGVLPPTAFFSVHLDAASEAQRVSSLLRCLEGARAMGTRAAVVAGDLNTELLPGSCVAAVLHGIREPTAAELEAECAKALRLEGEEAMTAEQLQEWKDLWKSARAAPQGLRMAVARAPTGPTRAAYALGASEGPCVGHSLDHILHSPGFLSLESCWETLEADPGSQEAGMPNATCPSDHLPVAATFEVLRVPSLPAEEREALLTRVSELGRRQQEELACLREACREEAEALEVVERADGNSEITSHYEGGKRKKGGGRQPPSEAMMNLKRSHRAREKEAKAKHLREREALLSLLTEVELDALDGSIDSSAWLEAGGPV